MVSWERLRADALSLQTLAALNSRHLTVLERAPDLRRFAVEARIDAPIAAGEGFQMAPVHELVVEIPDDYLGSDGSGRFVKSRIKRTGERLFHPNVWPSDGYICFDDQFFPEKSLADQFVSVVELMQLRAVNHGSPANWDADYYYLQHKDSMRAQIRPVHLMLPKGGVRLRPRELPRVS
jgi:hypothetical protein